ncbi:MAG: Transcription initiation factor TFIID subunit 5 [Claussenomyces sp. TS43310]|nr:MAG: Transcription initiation factor TFIID subunit 5 [Claussenomyces sp. TS43310]
MSSSTPPVHIFLPKFLSYQTNSLNDDSSHCETPELTYDPQVIEYLMKKGYTRTEQTLRAESSNVDKDGRPIIERAEDTGTEKYKKAFELLSGWIDQNLDVYKFELRRLLWPVYVYSYLELVMQMFPTEASSFLQKYKWQFEGVHADELRVLETITLPQHVQENSITKLYRENKYRLPLNTHIYYNLVTFLEQNGKRGGTVVLHILSTYCKIKETERGPIDQFSFEAIINRATGLDIVDGEDMEEGIPGGFTGVSNQDMQNNNAPIKLGPQPMETDLAQDVRADLEDEDAKNPPDPGQMSLVEIFDQNIKREESADAISRIEIPYPPSRARDIAMEVQKTKEYRDRFKIESRTGGIGPGVSASIFDLPNVAVQQLANSLRRSITCIEFSDDNLLVAVGTEDSYIRVWKLDGGALTSTVPSQPNDPPPSNSRRLIGHSGPVHSVSFSSSATPLDSPDAPSTHPRLLLSASSDRTVRLWSLDAWACLVVYKGHEGPVWNVRWGPFGHYFVTCGWDKTVRVWAQDHVAYLRMMVGHDSNVNQIAWHPNGAYVFSASDQVDKTIRMWSFSTGQCVRVFTGHTEFISTLECSPDGKILASADGGGSIILWDLAKGTQIKRCRGHGRGGIWSLSFSVESTVLISGGADGTVRLWDISLPTDPYKITDGEVVGTGGQADATRLTGAAAGAQSTAAGPSGSAGVGPSGVSGGSGGGGGVGGGKKKGKEMVITPDQISAFPTKKSPVYKVKFTRMNLALAGGCYLP